jgi:4-hydroxy-L-threonine phosphate dehydrogenase PdxA
MKKPAVAIATGDPGGIGREISLRAALDPAVQSVCGPVLVGDPAEHRAMAEAITRLVAHRRRAPATAKNA